METKHFFIAMFVLLIIQLSTFYTDIPWYLKYIPLWIISLSVISVIVYIIVLLKADRKR